MSLLPSLSNAFSYGYEHDSWDVFQFLHHTMLYTMWEARGCVHASIVLRHTATLHSVSGYRSSPGI